MIAVVLDASGSMGHLKVETISALNKLISEQQAVPGEALFTLAQFSDPTAYKLIRDAVPLATIKPITPDDYNPSGYTALVDAMGKTIDDVGRKLAAMPEAERPDKVVFVVMTDGHENASREYRHDQVMEKVKHQTEKYGWQFLFLGAGPDAIQQGGAVGIGAAAAMSYNASQTGVHKAIASTSDVLRSYRSGASASVSYSNSHRSDNS